MEVARPILGPALREMVTGKVEGHYFWFAAS